MGSSRAATKSLFFWMLGIHSLNGQRIKLEVSVIIGKKVSPKLGPRYLSLEGPRGLCSIFGRHLAPGLTSSLVGMPPPSWHQSRECSSHGSQRTSLQPCAAPSSEVCKYFCKHLYLENTDKTPDSKHCLPCVFVRICQTQSDNCSRKTKAA